MVVVLLNIEIIRGVGLVPPILLAVMIPPAPAILRDRIWGVRWGLILRRVVPTGSVGFLNALAFQTGGTGKVKPR